MDRFKFISNGYIRTFKKKKKNTNDTQMKIQMIIIRYKETLALSKFSSLISHFFPDVSSSLLYFSFILFLSFSFLFFLETYFLPHLPVNDGGRGVTARWMDWQYTSFILAGRFFILLYSVSRWKLPPPSNIWVYFGVVGDTDRCIL